MNLWSTYGNSVKKICSEAEIKLKAPVYSGGKNSVHRCFVWPGEGGFSGH